MMANLGVRTKADSSPAAASVIAAQRATRTDSAPEAMGRKRLSGWARSFSTSTISLNKYTELDSRQNDATAAKVAIRAWRSSIRRAKIRGGATKNTFFTHWW